jgi:hypothetical protein
VRFARRQEFKAITEAYRAGNRPINRLMAAKRRARGKLKRLATGDATVRPLTVIELRALGRPADEIAAAEARIVREREEKEDRERAAGFAKIDREWTPSPRSTAPQPDAAQTQLDDIQRVADRQARRPKKAPPTPEPTPEPPPPSVYFLTPEQLRSVDAGRRLRHLLDEARTER